MKASKVNVSLAVKLVCDDDHCFHTDFTTKLVLDSKSKVGVSLAGSCFGDMCIGFRSKPVVTVNLFKLTLV